MARKRKSKGESRLKKFLSNERVPKVLGLVSILLSLFLLVAFVSYLFTWKADQSAILQNPWGHLSGQSDNALGRFGAVVSHQFFYRWVGLTAFLFPLVLLSTGVNLLLQKPVFPLKRIYGYGGFTLIVLPFLLSYIFYSLGSSGFAFGGAMGNTMADWFTALLGQVGTGLLLFFVILGFAVVAFNTGFGWLIPKKKEKAAEEADNRAGVLMFDQQLEAEKELPKDFETREEMEYSKDVPVIIDTIVEDDLEDAEEEETEDDSGHRLEIEAPVEEELVEDIDQPVADVDTEEEEDRVKFSDLPPYDPRADLSDFKFPTIDLLEDYGQGKINIDTAELERNKDQIIQTLSNYNIQISKIKATVGPTVTLYEIIPAPGVRISRIKNLEDDIALSLAALGIRIIAPIPGKGTIGIEVPNANKDIVSMRSMLASEKFQSAQMELPIALGKTIANENYIADLSKMPHLLMAGATGQGKSVGLNAILVSLLFKKHPSELKLILIDPKKVELTLYKHIEKHYLAKLPDEAEAIVTDTRKVVHTLNALCIEMDERYDLMKEAHVRNIAEYNEKFIKRRLNPEKGHRYLPYFVMVVDEFADLMMTAGKEVEGPITRLAQLARAIGIHLVIATQRPSVNIITGTIKANFPARVAFKVTAKVDSRTILDGGGADQLIGRGDMLLSIGGHIIRLQCPFVDTHEVEKICNFIGQQRGYAEAFFLPEYVDENELKDGGFDSGEMDELFEEAARLIVRHQSGSTSLIQRKMKLGYNRAGRIMDQLCEAGVVGPSEGSKAREVLIQDEYALEQFLKNLHEVG
jgi:S-DNA-T family DNA segregation ATPase FtsK/SpoIIIE